MVWAMATASHNRGKGLGCRRFLVIDRRRGSGGGAARWQGRHLSRGWPMDGVGGVEL
jgi:hypothetical protein